MLGQGVSCREKPWPSGLQRESWLAQVLRQGSRGSGRCGVDGPEPWWWCPPPRQDPRGSTPAPVQGTGYRSAWSTLMLLPPHSPFRGCCHHLPSLDLVLGHLALMASGSCCLSHAPSGLSLSTFGLAAGGLSPFAAVSPAPAQDGPQQVLSVHCGSTLGKHWLRALGWRVPLPACVFFIDSALQAQPQPGFHLTTK